MTAAYNPCESVSIICYFASLLTVSCLLMCLVTFVLDTVFEKIYYINNLWPRIMTFSYKEDFYLFLPLAIKANLTQIQGLGFF